MAVPEITEQQAKQLFADSLKKIEQVRNISAPILKVITLAKCMDEIMGLVGEIGEISDADVLFNMLFYIMIQLKSDDCQYLGARFIEECSYIDAFLHED
jgi:hypothetical protein